MEATKKCSHCKKALPLTKFPNSTSRKDGKHHNCKACANALNRDYRKKDVAEYSAKTRNYHLKRAYGLSDGEYAALLTSQGGVCAICGTADTGTFQGKPKQMAVDHDHATGAVRGLLCAPCNQGLGNFGDDPDRLLTAAKYLAKRLP